MLGKLLDNVRQRHPLVHNITNPDYPRHAGRGDKGQ